MKWICRRAVALIAFAPITNAIAADDWLKLDEQLWAIRDVAESDSPHASAKALVQWIRSTPAVDIEKSLELSRSNVESGVFEVIAGISSRGDHADALDAADELVKRLPNSNWHDDIVAVKAKLLLRLGRLEESRSLARGVDKTVCPSTCGADVKKWLAEGTVPRPILESAPKQPWLYDERGSACEISWATDKLDEFDSIDLIEASAGVRVAAQTQLAALWPSLVAGCAQPVAKQRLQRLLALGWTRQELAESFTSVRNETRRGSLKSIDVLGAKLALPDVQCDFAADTTCRNRFQQLSDEAGARIVDRLRILTRAWASETSDSDVAQVSQSRKQGQSREQLAEAYENEMRQASRLDATSGLSLMRKVLADSKYGNLGLFLDSYSFGQGLGRWSREGHAAEALDVLNIAAVVGGTEFRSSSRALTAAALLQLRAGEPKEALASLENSYAMSPNEGTIKMIGKLRAAIAGANILQQLPPPTITRPWRYSSARPICDFFDITGGLERIEDVDLVSAFHGEREAALWQLAQQWPAVVGHCYNPATWRGTRLLLQRALGSEGFPDAVANAKRSLVVGDAPHFVFGGQELPLPDSERPVGASDREPVGISHERLLQIIDETHLLELCGGDGSEFCN